MTSNEEVPRDQGELETDEEYEQYLLSYIWEHGEL